MASITPQELADRYLAYRRRRAATVDVQIKALIRRHKRLLAVAADGVPVDAQIDAVVAEIVALGGSPGQGNHARPVYKKFIADLWNTKTRGLEFHVGNSEFKRLTGLDVAQARRWAKEAKGGL